MVNNTHNKFYVTSKAALIYGIVTWFFSAITVAITKLDHKGYEDVKDKCITGPLNSHVSHVVSAGCHSRKCRTLVLLSGNLSTLKVTRDDIIRSNPRDYVVICQHVGNRQQATGCKCLVMGLAFRIEWCSWEYDSVRLPPSAWGLMEGVLGRRVARYGVMECMVFVSVECGTCDVTSLR
jgi:hypothetical protein